MGALEYYTYADYVKWEGNWELIFGSPYAMAPSPVKSHQAIAYSFAFELSKSVEDCDNCLVLGEEDYKVNDETVLKPDIVLLCDDNDDNYITKAPAIVIEVISPSTARRDEKHKFEIYQDEKIKYYVLIYPDDLRAKIFKLENNKYTKEGDFFNQEYIFDELECKASVDFQKVFRKFKK